MNSLNNKGMTLTELIVATMLIAIVMGGVASFVYAVKQIQDVSNKSALLSMKTAATMSHMARNAQLAIGWINDMGIRTGSITSDEDYISFRQDTNDTPDDYTDDLWTIYIYNDNFKNIYTCTQTLAQVAGTAVDGAPWLPDTGGPTCSSAPVIQDNIELASFQIRGDDAAEAADLDFGVEIYIKARYDAGRPGGAIPPVDPVENPEYELLTKISPLAHSWN